MALGLDLDALADNRRASFIATGIAVAFLAVASVISIAMWLSYNPTIGLAAEVPGLDGVPTGADAKGTQVQLSGIFTPFDGTPADLTGSWPTFRGERHDNIVHDGPELADSWGSDGPEILWKVAVGGGYASPSVKDGIVYLMDYNEDDRADVLRAFSLETGEEIWQRSYKVMVKRNHGMSRTIPAVTDKFVVTIGPKCHVVCVDAKTGDFNWGKDLQYDYGTEEPLWYSAQCTLIQGEEVILAPCGDEVLMMGVDGESGDVLWETPNPRGWNMSHSSIIPMTLLGKKMYVYGALGGVAGVSAEGADKGTLLWDIPWNAKVVAPSPVQVSEDHVFMTAGYASGNLMIKVHEENGNFTAEQVYAKLPGEGLSCEQQTPVFANDLLYGILPKDAGALKGQFVAYTLEGDLVWSSGSDNRFGFGPFILADDKFYIMDDHGTLTMLEASATEYVQLGQAHLLDGHDPWGPITLVGNRMFLRDLDNLICVDVG